MDDLELVPGNPWQDVAAAEGGQAPVKYATDDQIEQFYDWIAARFGDWPFPKLFLSTKAFTGCRLMDLCASSRRSCGTGGLMFPPDVAKGRKEREVPLPADLSPALDAFKGGTWLWENYVPELKAALKAKGWPTHQLKTEFSPQRLYYWVETLFADYRKASPDRPPDDAHVPQAGVHDGLGDGDRRPAGASIAYGCNVDTLVQHYVALDEQAVTDDVFAQLHGVKRKSRRRGRGGISSCARCSSPPAARCATPPSREVWVFVAVPSRATPSSKGSRRPVRKIPTVTTPASPSVHTNSNRFRGEQDMFATATKPARRWNSSRADSVCRPPTCCRLSA